MEYMRYILIGAIAFALSKLDTKNEQVQVLVTLMVCLYLFLYFRVRNIENRLQVENNNYKITRYFK